MKNKVDEVYSEVRSRLKYGLGFTDDPLENTKILDREVEKTNITKCGLVELEKEYPEATTYLTYLLQSKDGVNFNVCPDFKVWYNRKGCQARCKHNQGPTQVHCRGSLKQCPRKEKMP